MVASERNLKSGNENR